MSSTPGKSYAHLLEGDKLYVQRARLALPILIRQAKAQKPITYSQLADELEMPNPRNLNNVLGKIGNTINALSGKHGLGEIPMINFLVVNKSKGLPGDGISGFIKMAGYDKYPNYKKRAITEQVHSEIFYYPFWDKVLTLLNLAPATSPGKPFKPSQPGGGESPEHKKFKEYIAKHPEIFNLHADSVSEVEHEFGSMDKIDVLFIHNGLKTGIEVKSNISDENDICRGLFQCVKYKALLRAEQIVDGHEINCQVILAIQGKFPKSLIPLRNALGIEVWDDIKITKAQPAQSLSMVDQ